jgi:hypothetical protein
MGSERKEGETKLKHLNQLESSAENKRIKFT